MKITEENEWKIALAFLVLMGMGFLSYKVYKYFYPDIPGYCYSQKRFLSDEEFIQSALRRVLKGSPYSRPDIDGSEASIRNFHSDHPGCCQILRIAAGKEPEGAAFSDIWHVAVLMSFKSLEKFSPSSPAMYTSYTVLNECGKVLEHSGGG